MKALIWSPVKSVKPFTNKSYIYYTDLNCTKIQKTVIFYHIKWRVFLAVNILFYFSDHLLSNVNNTKYSSSCITLFPLTNHGEFRSDNHVIYCQIYTYRQYGKIKFERTCKLSEYILYWFTVLIKKLFSFSLCCWTFKLHSRYCHMRRFSEAHNCIIMPMCPYCIRQSSSPYWMKFSCRWLCFASPIHKPSPKIALCFIKCFDIL